MDKIRNHSSETAEQTNRKANGVDRVGVWSRAERTVFNRFIACATRRSNVAAGGEWLDSRFEVGAIVTSTRTARFK